MNVQSGTAPPPSQEDGAVEKPDVPMKGSESPEDAAAEHAQSVFPQNTFAKKQEATNLVCLRVSMKLIVAHLAKYTSAYQRHGDKCYRQQGNVQMPDATPWGSALKANACAITQLYVFCPSEETYVFHAKGQRRAVLFRFDKAKEH